MAINERIYYVYLHITADTNEVFYVGKGSGSRIGDKCGKKQPWWDVYNEHDYYQVKIAEGLTEDEAYIIEGEMIDYWKNDMGMELANLTAGKHPQNVAPEIWIKNNKYKFNPNLGRKLSDESVEKIRSEHVLEMADYCNSHPSGRSFPVFSINMENGKITDYKSAREAKRKDGFDSSKIGKVLHNKQHYHRGHYWYYLDGQNHETKDYTIPVYSKDLKTHQFEYFDSFVCVEKKYGFKSSNINAVVLGKRKSAYGRLWYRDEEKLRKRRNNKIARYTSSESHQAKPVFSVDLDGNRNDYQSVQEAANRTGINATGISKTINGFQKISGGKEWFKLDDELTEDELKVKKEASMKKIKKPKVRRKPVYSLNLQTKEKEEFLSTLHAAEWLNCSRENIRDCILNKQKTAVGLIWRYSNESLNKKTLEEHIEWVKAPIKRKKYQHKVIVTNVESNESAMFNTKEEIASYFGASLSNVVSTISHKKIHKSGVLANLKIETYYDRKNLKM